MKLTSQLYTPTEAMLQSTEVLTIALPESKTPLTMLYWPRWLCADAADAMFASLHQHLPWQQGHIRMLGKWVAEPRLKVWMGQSGLRYTYSGTRHEALPWPPEVQALALRVAETTGFTFNSVLVNLYRNGHDSMGWHVDNEAELGAAPAIASLSLGCARDFCLKDRTGGQKLKLPLAHGSLLLMPPGMQAQWLHALPKRQHCTAPRINLTFRNIVVAC